MQKLWTWRSLHDKHEGNSLPVKEEAVDVACSGSFPAKKKRMEENAQGFASVC